MTAGDRTRPQRLFWSVAGVYVATWTWISWLSSPSLDPYGDMVENYAWSQTLAWGTFKHPPLVAWIVRAWFSMFPTHVWAYYLLSYLNAVLGILGIVALARLWLPDQLSPARRDVFAMMVLVLAAVSLPYSNLAAKFNTDTVLLSLWPWAAYAFFASMRASTTRARLLCTVLLAVMAATALLGKYYSMLLLATLAAVSLSHRDYRRWYRTPYPYGAAALGMLLLLPHAVWEIRMGFPFQNYLETKIDPGIDPGRVVVFLLSGIYYLPLSWLAWFALRRWLAVDTDEPVTLALPLRGLVLLTMLPALITAAFNVFAQVHLTTHWAIPVWFALPILLAVWLLPRIRDDFAWSRLSHALVLTWCVLVTGVLIYTGILSATGNPKYSLARREMVNAIEARFAARVPTERLSWAGGTWPESGAVAFFGANHPRALPGLPHQWRAKANPYNEWPNTYGVILCYASGDYARRGAHDTECERETRDWFERRRMPVIEETLTYRADGWRFLRAQEKNVTVFWVPPVQRITTSASEALTPESGVSNPNAP